MELSKTFVLWRRSLSYMTGTEIVSTPIVISKSRSELEFTKKPPMPVLYRVVPY